MSAYQKTILLVEDEELIRDLLARVLRESGYTVVEADNGASALQVARRLDGSIALVVADINMPVMDGLELARALRRTDRKIPFLFVTALDPALITVAGIQAAVLPKPFTPDEFLEVVARVSTVAPGTSQPA